MKVLSKTLKILLVSILVFVTGILLSTAWVISVFPNNNEIRGCLTTKMYHVSCCPKSKDYASLSEISPFLQKAVVLTEDSSFWIHQGFDLDELQRSLKKNLETGKYARGGSTISQQLAKNLFLTEEKTLLRKLKEAIITLRLEKVLSKKEILERYLNVVHFGKDIFGIKSAAQFYFHKTPLQLNLTESAFLTFLLPSPEKYSVSFFKGKLTPFAEKRMNQIIDNMFQYQRISEFEYITAKSDMKNFLKFEEAQDNAELVKELEGTEESAETEDD